MRTSLTPDLIRGARAMLGWSMLELSKAAGVSVSTVKRMEMAERQPMSDDIRLAVANALEAGGVFFLDDDGSGPGMRLGPRSSTTPSLSTGAAPSPRRSRLARPVLVALADGGPRPAGQRADASGLAASPHREPFRR